MSAPDMSPDGDAARVAALAGLPGIGPARLVAILAEHSPVDAWAAVREGTIERPPPRPRSGSATLFASSRPTQADRRPTWADLAARIDPVARWTPYARRGIHVTWPGRPDYPAALASDPNPPGALFWTGRLDLLDRPCVGIVGTRSATPDGRATAFAMGRDLAEAGICVVSGLAKGIDGAAHLGALTAGGSTVGGTVGVAASGVDVPYPPEHYRLWCQVTASGAIVSETPPGRPAQGWRFPSRNRVIAGLVSMVVVVESHPTGGSLITAEAAMERGIEVRVVPGPVHSSASAGSNQLLYDGPGPVRDAQDVLDALGWLRPARRKDPPRPPRRDRVPPAGEPPTTNPPATDRPTTNPAATDRPAADRPPAEPPGEQPPPAAASVLAAIGGRPATVGQIMARSGLSAAEVGRSLDWLAGAGRVTDEGGWWVPVTGRRR